MSRDSPAACGEDHNKAAVPLWPMEVHGGAEIHLQSMEDPMREHEGCPKEDVTSWKPALEQTTSRTFQPHGESLC